MNIHVPEFSATILKFTGFFLSYFLGPASHPPNRPTGSSIESLGDVAPFPRGGDPACDRNNRKMDEMVIETTENWVFTGCIKLMHDNLNQVRISLTN